jgi:hypothetical protein
VDSATHEPGAGGQGVAADEVLSRGPRRGGGAGLLDRWMLLHQIQHSLHERVRFGPIWEYIWPSGLGPRVTEPALMLINPFPWSAPLEDVRLKEK